MKKRLLASVASMALGLPMIIATNMYIKQSDGKLLSFNVDKIEEVYFDDSNLADVSDLPLKFEILSDSTVEVKQDSSYKDLSSVTIPEKVRIDGKVYDVTGIGEQAFHACYMLKSLDIPASIKRIGNWSFAYCEYTKEIKIPLGLESIGSYAFYGCYALTEMSLPSSVTSIEDYAFQNCKNLDLVIDNSEENITLGDGVFDNCKSVKYLKGDSGKIVDISKTPLKFEILSDSTVEVKQDSSYKDLSSVTIPEKVRIDGKVYDVTGIGEQAFHACYMLKSLDIPASIKRIGNWSFAYCEYTKEIKIPLGLESIGSYAFYGCYALTEMSLPSSVTSIEDYAFQNCKNLDLVIDNSEENITLGDGVFDNCKSVKFLK